MADSVFFIYFLIVNIWLNDTPLTKAQQACVTNRRVTPRLDPRTVRVSWTWGAPSANCGLVDTADELVIDYYLRVQDQCETIEDEQSTRVTLPSIFSGSMQFKDVTGLIPFSTYRITITLRIRLGNDIIHDFVVNTSDAVPSGPPENLRSTRGTSSSLEFSWDEVACGDRMANITMYGVRLVNSEDGTQITQTTGLGVMQFRFTDLSPNTTYEFSVQAQTLSSEGQVRSGPYSDSLLSATTLAIVAASSEPRNVTVYDITQNSMKLKWTVPLNQNGINTFYEIQYNPIDNSQTTSLETHVDLDNLVFLLRNLEPGTTYEIRISGNKYDEEQRKLEGRPAVITATTTDVPGPSTVMIIGIAVGGVLLIVIAVATVIALFKKKLMCFAARGVDAPEAFIAPVRFDMLPQGEYESFRNNASRDSSYWDIAWQNLEVLDTVLGEGSFGKVLLGNVYIGDDWFRVAVKTLPGNAPHEEAQNFERELNIMKRLGRHENIVSLVGACKHKGMLYVALEHMSHGNLLNFLRSSHVAGENNYGLASNLTSTQLISFALDVARGMKHLSEHGIIHRDLAARNVLVGNGYEDLLVAKVSDFGLSRGDEIYMQTLDSKTRIPVRWSAIEAFTTQKYTTQSDVWSFGVLLWEIASLGSKPYPQIDNIEVHNFLQSGKRMDKPENCDEKLYILMMRCWNPNPTHRPTFAELVDELTVFLEDDALPYVITEIGGHRNTLLVPIEYDSEYYE